MKQVSLLTQRMCLWNGAHNLVTHIEVDSILIYETRGRWFSNGMQNLVGIKKVTFTNRLMRFSPKNEPKNRPSALAINSLWLICNMKM